MLIVFFSSIDLVSVRGVYSLSEESRPVNRGSSLVLLLPSLLFFAVQNSD